MKNIATLVLFIGTLFVVSCSSNDEPKLPPVVENQLAGFVKDGVTKTLDASIVYNLDGPLVVLGGGTLTIPAGTKIEATGGTSAYIAVSKDATININGTAAKPVVMTSGKATKAPGDWGGLVICGNAVTNVGKDATSEVGGLTYGGENNADSSGSITYLRVEYTGAKFSSSKEFNGVSLFAVGSGTTFEYISSVKGSDDGIEFFGGAVKGKYLVSIDSEDDSIDFADGYTGFFRVCIY